MTVIKALFFAHELSLSFASFGHLYASIKSTINAFNSISFSHTRRLGNLVAHNLTKYAKHFRGLLVWMKDIPPHLHVVLLVDHD